MPPAEGRAAPPAGSRLPLSRAGREPPAPRPRSAAPPPAGRAAARCGSRPERPRVAPRAGVLNGAAEGERGGGGPGGQAAAGRASERLPLREEEEAARLGLPGPAGSSRRPLAREPQRPEGRRRGGQKENGSRRVTAPGRLSLSLTLNLALPARFLSSFACACRRPGDSAPGAEGLGRSAALGRDGGAGGNFRGSQG